MHIFTMFHALTIFQWYSINSNSMDCNCNKLSVNEIILMCFYAMSNNRLNELVINYNKYCYVQGINLIPLINKYDLFRI